MICLVTVCWWPPVQSDMTGSDDRVEVSQAAGWIQRLAHSVALVTSRHKLIRLPNGREANACSLLHSTLADEKLYCSDQRFSSQSIGGTCTAFLIAPDVLMTAAHCLPGEPGQSPFDLRESCESSAFVFDYWESDSLGQGSNFLPESNIYYCHELRRFQSSRSPSGLHRDASGPIDDYAFVKLDRAVPGRRPLKLFVGSGNTSDRRDRSVFALSHPHGLPLKVALSAKIDSAEYNYYRSGVDISVGSSGGPVLDWATGTVVGIIKGLTYPDGYRDMTWDEKRRCRSEYVFPVSHSPAILLEPWRGLRLLENDLRRSRSFKDWFGDHPSIPEALSSAE